MFYHGLTSKEGFEEYYEEELAKYISLYGAPHDGDGSGDAKVLSFEGYGGVGAGVGNEEYMWGCRGLP